jgi:ribosomal protein S18 acetylase RimI-like enzyme
MERTITTATMADLDLLTEIEAACFPKAEAATRAEFRERLRQYADHFWILREDGKPLAFLDGMVTDEPTIRDEMYADASLHNEGGAWQAVFGLNTLPAYRRQGCAARLLRRAASDAQAQGRRGCILTCKERLIHYYEQFGYENCGISDSVHGGVVWYDMRLTF